MKDFYGKKISKIRKKIFRDFSFFSIFSKFFRIFLKFFSLQIFYGTDGRRRRQCEYFLKYYLAFDKNLFRIIIYKKKPIGKWGQQ